MFERRKAEKLAAGLRESGDFAGLQRLMQTGSDEERCAAANQFVGAGDLVPSGSRKSIEQDLMAAARDQSGDVRSQAIAALGSFHSQEAANLFLQGLEDQETVYFAIIALGQIREARAVPKLIEFLQGNPISLEAEFASRALLDIGTPEAIKALRVASRGPLPSDVREQLKTKKPTREESAD